MDYAHLISFSIRLSSCEYKKEAPGLAPVLLFCKKYRIIDMTKKPMLIGLK